MACAGALAAFSKLVEELNDGAKSRSVLAETFEKFRERSLQNGCSRNKVNDPKKVDLGIARRRIASFSTMADEAASSCGVMSQSALSCARNSRASWTT